MIVCHCTQMNDRRLREAMGDDACDVDELIARCGAGGRCGGCLPTLEALVAQVGISTAA